MEPLIFLLIAALAVYVYVVLPVRMAAARGRSRVGWLLISLLFSPLVAVVGLMVLGRALPQSKL
jgi:hypothetical protein